MSKITLPDGKYIFVPDHWSNAQVLAYTRELEEDEAETDILPALQRGFAKHAPDIIDLGAGAVGLAGDITDVFGERKFQETEKSIRRYANEKREDLAGEAGMDVSDTFVEKIAEGIGGVPGMAASMAPAMAVPGGGLVGAAAKFGAHGLAMSGGQGLTESLMGGAKGALMGAAFHGGGALSGGIRNAAGRRLAHAGTTGGIASGIEFMSGVPAEDALASGIALGAIAGLGKNPYRRSPSEAKRIAQTRELYEKMMQDPANEGRSQVEVFADAAEKYGTLAGASPEEFELSKVKKNMPRVDEENLKQLHVTSRRMIDMEGGDSLLNHLSSPQGKQHLEAARHADPWTYERAVAEVQQMPYERRQKISKQWGLGGEILSEHQLTNIQFIKKIEMAQIASEFEVLDSVYKNTVMAGEPKENIQRAKNNLDATVEDYVLKLSEWEGMRSEVGKALAWGKAEIKKSPIGERALHKAMRRDGGNPIPLDLVKRIMRNPDDYGAAHEVLRHSVNPKMRDKLYEVWVNGLLSGPPTHVVNTLSNAATQVIGTTERVGTGMLDAVLSKVEGRERQAFVSDVFGDLMGYMRGARIGWGQIKQVLKDETFGMEMAKQETETSMFNVSGNKGKVVRAPSRALRMMDVFFSAVGGQREGWAQAHRMATIAVREGKIKKSEHADYMKSIMKDPSAVLLERMNAAGKWAPMSLADRMEQAGRTQVFTSKPGKFTQYFQEGRRTIPLLKVVLPFVRTPANIMKFTLKRTPLGLLPAAEKYARYRRGELPAGPVVEEAAAALMGSAAMATVLLAANEGWVTGGGPSDWTEQANLRQTGWEPYSVWNPVLGKWWNYSRIEPVGTVFGMAADAAEMIRSGADFDDPEIPDKILAAFKDNITNKTFLTGLEALSKAWADPDMFGSAYAKTMMGSLVPNVVAQASNIGDQYIRDARFNDPKFGLAAPLAKRIPGLREQLPIKYSPMGKPIKSRDRVGSGLLGPAARGLMPFAESAPDPNAIVEMEMAKLAAFRGAPPSMPSRKKQVDMGDGNPYGHRVNLTSKEYETYHMYHAMAHNQMAAFILSPQYENMPPAQKAQALTSIYRKFQNAASRDIDIRVRQRYGVL